MKRFIFSILALCLLVCLVSVGAPHVQAAGHSHCVCGGDANGVGDHVCGASVTWEPWDGTTTLKDGGHYYLNDTDGDGKIVLSSTLTIEKKTVSICLNGVELTCAGRTLQVNGKTESGKSYSACLSICDCAGNGSITSTSKGIAPVLHSYTNNRGKVTIHLYGGQLIAKDEDNTQLENGTKPQAAGVMRLGNTSASSDAIYTSTFDMYGGSISGGMNSGEGGNVYISALGTFNLYGGVVTGGQAGTTGGNFYVAGTLNLRGGVISNGQAGTNGGGVYVESNGVLTIGGTSRVANNAVSNIYLPAGKTITVNTMYAPAQVGITLASGNIFATTDDPNSADFFFGDNGTIGTYTDGNLELVKPPSIAIMQGNTIVAYCTLQEAVTKLESNQYLKLQTDLEESVALPDGLYLDLNGHHLSGVTVNGTLYAFDSATDSYTGNQAGTLSYSGSGQVVKDLTTDITGETKRYLSLPEENGVSFHRIYVGITNLILRPVKSGLGYTATFRGDDAVKAAMATNKAYGYALWLDGYGRITRGQSAGKFTGNNTLTLGLNNIMKPDNALQDNIFNADTRIHAMAYIHLADGRVLESSQHSYSLKEIALLADAQYETYSSAKQQALQTMFTDYQTILLGWDMPNTIHSTGTWTDLNQENFATKIVKTGQYRLTSDIDLGDSTLTFSAGCTVTLCLNGHTISGTNRLFKVYGTLNICDCHADAQEGTITSSYAGETKTYAAIAYIYPGTMNIYGGNFTATGTLSDGGVLLIGSGTLNGVAKTPGKLNLFGGRIYGGSTTSTGGLLTLWDASTFTMYGGEMYSGVTQGSGGAISVGSSCTANLYGGKIYDCSANGNGGGVYCASGHGGLYIGEGMILANNSAAKGGNIYHNSDTTLTIDGASITGGSADTGGGVFANHAPITLSGDTVIRDNENGSLYLHAGNALDATGLTEGAEVHIYNVSAMPLGATAQYLTLERSGYKITTMGGQFVLIPESFTVPTAVEGFQVGFGRTDISPTEVGLPLAGYGNASSRLSTTTGVNGYDELKVSCVAITDENGETVLLMSVDLIRPNEELMDTIFPAITAATGVPESHIFTNFTHTHSVPETKSTTDPKIQRYNAMLPDRFAESANLAMNDRAPATMETGSFEVGDYGKQLNFTRHYQYVEDGIVKYFGDNFGTATVDSTTTHVTEADHTMHLVKFTRDGTDILMANWRVHPHMTGGGSKTYVSADLIGTTRYHFEKDTDCYFIYLQGAAGNINETSKLDDEKHGYTYYKYGNDLANQIDIALTNHCLKPTPVGLWQVDNYSYTAISDIATEAEYQHAKAASADFNAWLAENPNATSAEKKAKCEELGYLTWFHFNNVITRHSLNETYQLPLNTFSLGSSLAFFTAPGELWDTVSMEIEAASPFAMTMCIGYSQDHFNYFVYDPNNGGELPYESYEGNNYRFVAPDTVNDFIAYWKTTLNELYANVEN